MHRSEGVCRYCCSKRSSVAESDNGRMRILALEREKVESWIGRGCARLQAGENRSRKPAAVCLVTKKNLGPACPKSCHTCMSMHKENGPGRPNRQHVQSCKMWLRPLANQYKVSFYAPPIEDAYSRRSRHSWAAHGVTRPRHHSQDEHLLHMPITS